MRNIKHSYCDDAEAYYRKQKEQKQQFKLKSVKEMSVLEWHSQFTSVCKISGSSSVMAGLSHRPQRVCTNNDSIWDGWSEKQTLKWNTHETINTEKW